MKILFLCNKSPWPPKEGGPMAMNMFIEGLLEAGHEVQVLAINSFKYQIDLDSIPMSYRQRTGIRLVDVDLRVKPLAAFLNLFTRHSYHVQRFISREFKQVLTEILTSHTFDVIQLETLFMAPYLETIRLHSAAKVFLRAHNIEHLIWQRVAEETKNPLKRGYVSHLAKRLKNYEHQTLPEFDGIIAITPTDAAYFREVLQKETQRNSPQNGPNHPVAVTDIPFGVNLQSLPSFATTVEFPSLYTIGAMNWIPNQEGVKWFLLHVWMDVHQQFPDLKYYLAGREMPDWMRRLDLPNVVVMGEVADAGAFIASKSIMIAPLFSGSGIRVKIIEGMAAGKTIISTTLGAEGIRCTNRENILIANLPCEFFEMISICVNDQALCNRVGKNAKELIAREYNRPVLIEKLNAFYQQHIR